MCLIYDLLYAKITQKSQVLYYIRNYTLLSIFSALARLICHTFLYDLLRQYWCMNTRSLTPLNKWPQSIVVISWRLLHIHKFHHTTTHPSLSKLLDSHICYFPFESFFFLPTSIKHRAYLYLIHTFKYIYIIVNPRLLCHLFHGVQINTTQTPPSQLQNTTTYIPPNIYRTHPYYITYPPYTHYTQHN